MGITIVQKSDLKTRKRDPKVALVLAGGAVTGGAFKLGGLKALDDFLVNRKTTEFDTYVGLSAGAVLAAPLACGISPAEMIKSLEGKSTELTRFRARDFYSPNFREFVERPLEYALAVALFLPGTVADLIEATPKARRASCGRPCGSISPHRARAVCRACWHRSPRRCGTAADVPVVARSPAQPACSTTRASSATSAATSARRDHQRLSHAVSRATVASSTSAR